METRTKRYLDIKMWPYTHIYLFIYILLLVASLKNHGVGIFLNMRW